MMTRMQQSYPERQRPDWWHGLHLWQRALIVAVVFGALLISAGLIALGTGAHAGATSIPVVTTTTIPMYPPGIDEYYYWGQGQPLSQQP
jgi:hypothetical protein